MAIKYEVWARTAFEQGGKQPTYGGFYTLDRAIEVAKKSSKGTTIGDFWLSDPSTWIGKQKQIEQPNTAFVIERSGNSSMRGLGSNGKWLWATQCARCKGTGLDHQSWALFCVACGQAGWVPNI